MDLALQIATLNHFGVFLLHTCMLGARGARASAQSGCQRVLGPDVLRRVHAADKDLVIDASTELVTTDKGHVMSIQVLWRYRRRRPRLWGGQHRAWHDHIQHIRHERPTQS
jgi:hypothetical protein